MKFELSFNKEIYNKQMDLLFDLAWERKIEYYKNAQYLGIILIIVGIGMIYNRPNILGVGYVLMFFGLTNLVPFVYYYFKIKRTSKKFEIAKTKEIQINVDAKNFSWEFTEESLIINIQDETRIVNWKEFLIFFVKEDNLILITKNFEPFIVGKVEVGHENFETLISFVEKKIN